MLVYITTYASPKTANGTINMCTPVLNTLFLYTASSTNTTSITDKINIANTNTTCSTTAKLEQNVQAI